VTDEELQNLELGCVLRFEPTGEFYVVVDKSGEYPRVINSRTVFKSDEWKLVRKAGEIVEGWNEL
jgi:hypothetical protein